MMDTMLYANSSGTHEVKIQSFELMKRILWLNGDITPESANSLIRKISVLSTESEKPIKLFISSNGGSVEDGLAIYDVITGCSVPIYTCAVARAYSMGGILLSAGTKRFCLPHTKIMLHKPLVTNPSSGNDKDMMELVKNLQICREQLNTILVEHTGQALSNIEDATDYDHYFTATEAKEFNLIDEIITYSDFIERG